MPRRDDLEKIYDYTVRGKVAADVTDDLTVTLGYNYIDYLDNRGNMYTPELHRNLVPAQVGRLYTPYTYASNHGTDGVNINTASATDYRWSSIILGIVKSAPFQMRRFES